MKVLKVHTPFNPKRPMTLVALGIRKVTGNHWNHCALLIDLLGIKLIVESDIKGVSIIPFKNWIKEQEIEVWNVKKSKTDYSKILSKAGRAGYSFADLFWFMPIYLLTGKFYGKKVDGFSNKPTCYEFVAWVFGFENWYRIDPNEFSRTIMLTEGFTNEGIFKAKDYEAVS